MKSIGIKIKQLRLKNELNQTEFAKSIGVNQSSISAIEETGKISVKTLISICEKYKVPFSNFYKGTRVKDDNAMQAEIDHLRKQNKLLEEMVALLKNKRT